ncbi:D-serine ammonia-lyase [Paracoccus aminophilus]|uniref:Probable D-serine dehydratase n=1 Tax=Paracoccus aminophilus JCM 7686 TaxID=1367847 RepID=S5Z1J7_PARAH|nr:D-serine ammonia-lyase [Paracoccus aminophilus]AGT11321.1 D-serine dehydratase [Paracoccus aminophilus JCM 7686]
MSITLPDDPARSAVLAGKPVLWLNPQRRPDGVHSSALPIRPVQVELAEANWQRLAPLLTASFPELAATGGRIRSDLIEAVELRDALGYGAPEFGRIFVKADNALPVAGSIKARGGVYEVFMFAESLARQNGLLPDGDIMALRSDAARALFARHTIAVGSTGNLGLSVGIAARALGFRAVVHMSSDAKAWKVERLTKLGVEVVQHQADYTTAVEEARAGAEADPTIYFVDDERSELLFFGYSAAAQELAGQLAKAGITVNADHPLFVYLPCGIGGAPGGAAYGIKAIFGDAAHCFFVEPVQSPCAMVQMMSGRDELVSVYDVGLTNQTEADGMAVARMSAFVAEVMKPMLAGVFTVADDDLFRWLWQAQTTQDIRLEPSATAGIAGPGFLVESAAGQRYQAAEGLAGKMNDATHIVWTTGGAFVPEAQFEEFMAKGAALTA